MSHFGEAPPGQRHCSPLIGLGACGLEGPSPTNSNECDDGSKCTTAKHPAIVEQASTARPVSQAWQRPLWQQRVRPESLLSRWRGPFEEAGPRWEPAWDTRQARPENNTATDRGLRGSRRRRPRANSAAGCVCPGQERAALPVEVRRLGAPDKERGLSRM
ncbi:hypothetical protein MTO96_013918 [Rhipicephalus appendiculatus]